MRGRSYTPSSPRGYGRRGRSPSPRGRYGGSRSRDLPTSLLVRNLRHDCRPDDLRRPFEQFGALKDIYLPRDYYTREPRGFGFVQFVDPADAADAKHRMDGYMLMGRELTVVFAEENRKKPVEMRQRERGSNYSGRAVGGGRYDRRRSPPRYSRSPRYSQSPPPRYARRAPRSHDDYYSPPRRRFTRSPTPQGKRVSRERSRTPMRPSRERSYSRSPPPMNGSLRERSYSRSRTPPVNGSRSRSQSPVRGRSMSRSPNPPGNYMNGERPPSR